MALHVPTPEETIALGETLERSMEELKHTALQVKAERDRLLTMLETLEQAYANKHSPQHRLACRLQARALIDEMTKP